MFYNDVTVKQWFLCNNNYLRIEISFVTFLMSDFPISAILHSVARISAIYCCLSLISCLLENICPSDFSELFDCDV